MPIFHPNAYEAACRGQVPDALTEEHFESWEKLEEALLWLPTDEQRSDAIYGDWLLQLNNPGGTERLAIKSLLIGSGALAANYLAELAQNANDAADMKEAEIRVMLHGNWLVFSNNGRKVTPLNQIGLCRFFRHFDPGLPLMQVIGQFGVGFKSSFRIADEVFVESWAGESKFSFRLPITAPSREQSFPNEATRQRILRQLEQVGERLHPNLMRPDFSGFCTPEAIAHLPSELQPLASRLGTGNRGTFFAFHLHDEGRREVASRIQGQSHELYELNPIFLPWLRTVQVGPNVLKMRESGIAEEDGVPGSVEAVKVTLATTLPDGRKSNSRFWRLRGICEGDRWQLALHADSDFKLRVERAGDEQGFGLKEGAAYAFFPLNKVNWPFRLHLHIELQPNLARDDWNPNLAPSVEGQITRAVKAFADWLEQHADRRHENWRIEDLVRDGVGSGDRWAKIAWEALLAEVRSRPLLKTVWGTLCRADKAVTVRLFPKDQVRKNWVELCACLTGLSAEFPIVNATGAMDFKLQPMGDALLRDFFLKAAQQCHSDDSQQKLVTALLTIEDIDPETLEEIAEHITIQTADGPATLASICQQRGGCELSEAWHRTFDTLRSWLSQTDQNPHGLTSFFWGQLRFVLKGLSSPVFNPKWQRIPEVLSTEQQWAKHGEQFWGLERDACTTSIRKTVFEFLRIKDGGPGWVRLDEIWLADTTAPQCFHGVVRSWNRGGVPHYNALRQAEEKLRKWGLWEAWEDAVEKRLREKLSKALTEQILKGMNLPPGHIAVTKPFEEVFSDAHRNTRGNLPTRWEAIVQQSEKQAIKAVLRERASELEEGRLLSPELPKDTRTVLALSGHYASAPFWLTSFAVECIRETGEFDPHNLNIIGTRELDTSKKREAVSMLLAAYHKWEDRQLAPGEINALNELCVATPTTLRGNWSVGLTSKTTVLLKDLLNHQATDPANVLAGDDLANLPLLQNPKRKWLRVQELPAPLLKIPAIAEASLQASQFTVQVDIPGHPLPITQEQVDAEAQADPLFKTLLQSAGGNILRCRSDILVRWMRGEDVVAELRDAPFAIRDGNLYTNRAAIQAEDRQFTEVLALYSQRARPDEAFQRFQQIWQTGSESHADVYGQFRDEVKATLLKTEVTDLGYRKHHVIRELLQNAESAYDSMAGELPKTCGFELMIRPPVQGRVWQAIAKHCGRPFNETLKTGEERNDISLIVRTPSAEAPPTEGWVGRFNRGFKSIFTVADSVEVVSGAYRFTIQDMLLLNPANPPRLQSEFNQTTSFTFRCSATDAKSLLKLSRTDGNQPPLTLFNPSTFVFLFKTNVVRLQFDHWVWEWERSADGTAGNWVKLAVRQSHPATLERFLVHHGHTREAQHPNNKRFGVALRVDANGLPLKLEDDWRKVRLTFETEEEFPLHILVNGDFEAEPGRLGIRNNSANEEVFAACLKLAIDLCESDLAAHNAKDRWIAWAEALNLHDGDSVLRQRFEGHCESLIKEHARFTKILCSRIPHKGVLASLASLKFPTTFLRRIEAFIKKWRFGTDDWIDLHIDGLLPKALRDAQVQQSFDAIVGRLAPASQLLRQINADMTTAEFQQLATRLPAQQVAELERARRIIEEKLRPVAPPDGGVIPPPVIEEWSVSDLLAWWTRKEKPLHEYTLDGANWALIYPSDVTPDISRAGKLEADLLKADQPEGKSVWYRIFGLACLMSAGRRVTEVRKYWAEELDGRNFWERTSGPKFADGADSLFEDLIRRPFSNATASGENAYFWRRVFYDLRKIHQMVWENEFPSVLLELASNPSRNGELINFLRSGQLAGQAPWVGVFGQSAGSPLFFLVRELRRIGVFKSPSLDRLSFFVCTPVRHAAQQIGWIEAELSSRADFLSLAETSERLYERIANDGEAGSELLKDYDIPLLHYGLTN